MRAKEQTKFRQQVATFSDSGKTARNNLTEEEKKDSRTRQIWKKKGGPKKKEHYHLKKR